MSKNIAQMFDDFRTLLALLMFSFLGIGVLVGTSILAFAILLAGCCLVFVGSYVICDILMKE